MLNVVLIPSNQLNVAAGDPGGAATPGATYEQDIWYPAALAASDEFAKQGHLAIVEYVRGVGTATTDELNLMCDRGVAWLKGQSGDKRVISFHSNAGSGVQYMYPLIGVEASRTWAHRVRDEAIKYTNFYPRNATVRSLMFFSHFNYLGANRALLMEIGEHQTAYDAAFLYKYREYLGRMMARSVIKACGYYLANDGPMALGVPVPPGFEKYAYSDPVGGGTVITYTRLLKLTDPLMKGPDVKFMQECLLDLGYKLPKYGADGWYGTETVAAVIAFQKHYWPTISSEWDGKIGPKTWTAIIRELGL